MISHKNSRCKTFPKNYWEHYKTDKHWKKRKKEKKKRKKIN